MKRGNPAYCFETYLEREKTSMQHKRFLYIFLICLLALTSLSGLALAQTEGGRIVVGSQAEPTTFDAHKSAGSAWLSLIGATLVAADPETGEIVPYLATSWQGSDDGLTWDFTLRDDVTFSDGTPLTAEDYAWTFTRWLDPATESPTIAAYSAISSAEAVDAHTLRLHLAAPFAPLLHSLTTGFAQPLQKAAVEAAGDTYGVNPVSTGPFVLKEWVPGERMVFARNPLYHWAPPFLHAGAPYIDELEYRIIPEYATIIAGLQTGELDTVFSLPINPMDVPLLTDAGFTIQTVLPPGMNPFVLLNTSKPPFDDVRVRQAFNYAINKDQLIAVAAGGEAIPQYSPISESVSGYWAGSEEIGYKYNLEQAKALLAEAGYADTDGDGIVEKDGAPFTLTMLLLPNYATLGQVLQDQYRQLGVQVELQQGDFGTVIGAAVSGEYQLAIGFYDYDDADVLYIFYNSASLGALNVSQVNDPTLDAILERTRTSINLDARQEAVTEAQRYIIEQAYTVPLYTPKLAIPISPRVQGLIMDKSGSRMYFEDATVTQ
jgi:peptide/nickel transport system substrate-binding protein